MSSHILGSMGAILLALCALPQVCKTIRTRLADDFDWSFLLLWLSGDALMLSYSILEKNLLLIANYGTNLVPICIIIYVKLLQSNKN